MIRHLHIGNDGYRLDTPGQEYTRGEESYRSGLI